MLNLVCIKSVGNIHTQFGKRGNSGSLCKFERRRIEYSIPNKFNFSSFLEPTHRRKYELSVSEWFGSKLYPYVSLLSHRSVCCYEVEGPVD